MNGKGLGLIMQNSTKRMAALLLTLVVLLTGFTWPAEAARSYAGTMNRNNVALRSQASNRFTTLAKIDKATPCRYGAPTVLVVAFDKNNVFTYPGGKRQSGVEDATIVATQMMLAACSEGVDSCWLNHFDPELLEKDLGLPENEEIVMLLDLGFGPAEGPAHRKERKPLEETVSYI